MSKQKKLQDENGYWLCSKCKQWKPPFSFYRDNRELSGLKSYCKQCSLIGDPSITSKEKIRQFLDKIKINHVCGCWEWQGDKNHKGYPVFHHYDQNGTLKRFGHRFAWLPFHDKIPNELFVCHTCDNPSYVNPNHLFLGTNRDNINDMIKKGRSNIQLGERNNNARLTKAVVQIIRNDYQETKSTFIELASKYSLDPSHIGKIIRRDRWSHV